MSVLPDRSIGIALCANANSLPTDGRGRVRYNTMDPFDLDKVDLMYMYVGRLLLFVHSEKAENSNSIH